jgi:hypothetical protein
MIGQGDHVMHQEFLRYQNRQSDHDKHEMIMKYALLYHQYLMQLPMKVAMMECVSGANRLERSEPTYLQKAITPLHIGDVCYIEYGHAYTYEAGFQHFGIILSVVQNKVFVVPMTSNARTYVKADPNTAYPLSHVFQLGLIPGLTKSSVCFLNDAKFINRARIINIKGHIDPESLLFKRLRKRVFETIFQ